MHSAVGHTKTMSINDIIPIFDVVLPPGAAPSQELHGEIFNFWALFHLVRLEGRLAFCALELHKQMIPHFLALDVGVVISQAQLCTFIRGCHATFLVKNTLFKGKLA